MPTQFKKDFFPHYDNTDSTDGLQSSLQSSLITDDNSFMGQMNETPKPLKTKSTSFMVEQNKEKSLKTNEEIIFDGAGGVTTM
jgi:hypothetical protein